MKTEKEKRVYIECLWEPWSATTHLDPRTLNDSSLASHALFFALSPNSRTKNAGVAVLLLLVLVLLSSLLQVI